MHSPPSGKWTKTTAPDCLMKHVEWYTVISSSPDVPAYSCQRTCRCLCMVGLLLLSKLKLLRQSFLFWEPAGPLVSMTAAAAVVCCCVFGCSLPPITSLPSSLRMLITLGLQDNSAGCQQGRYLDVPLKQSEVLRYCPRRPMPHAHMQFAHAVWCPSWTDKL